MVIVVGICWAIMRVCVRERAHAHTHQSDNRQNNGSTIDDDDGQFSLFSALWLNCYSGAYTHFIHM